MEKTTTTNKWLTTNITPVTKVMFPIVVVKVHVVESYTSAVFK